MKIPDDILERFEEKTEEVQYGTVSLTVSFNTKTGKPRFVIKQETSLLSDDDAKNGAARNKKQRAGKSGKEKRMTEDRAVQLELYGQFQKGQVIAWDDLLRIMATYYGRSRDQVFEGMSKLIDDGLIVLPRADAYCLPDTLKKMLKEEQGIDRHSP